MTKKIDSIYIHFPFCRHLCNYCDFFKKVPQNGPEELKDFHRYLEVSFVEHESLMKKHGYSWAPLKTLYLGGGTPSLWKEEGSEFLSSFLKKNKIELASDCEFTMEVNPGSWTEAGLNAWEKIGVNRYSLGVQSLDGNVIKNLDRVHTIDDVYETLEYFHKKDVNFSMDFMLGLPFSKDLNRDIIGELQRALKYSPDHFSVYILTVKNNYTHYNQLPDEEWVEKEFLEVASFLEKNNYDHYEVSNFALKNKKSNHNLRYWQARTVAAFGPSATGFLAEEGLRYKWKTKEAQMEIETLTDAEFQLESLYLALRAEGINLNDKIQKDSRWKEISEKWVSNGWASITTDNHLSLTSKGYLLLDSLMNDLFVQNLK
jgi:oxygen-independent coproporphyrinogen-3 oxidase